MTHPTSRVERRRALTCGLALAVAATLPISGCGGSGSPAPSAGGEPPPGPSPAPSPSPSPSPPPPAPTPLSRLKAALIRPAWRIGSSATPVVVQGPANDPAFAFGSGAIVVAAPGAGGSLADATSVWGRRRDRWSVAPAGSAVIGGRAVLPVTRRHVAASFGSEAVCGLHFTMQGAAFEILFAGTDVRITLVVDGEIVAPGVIDRAWSGGVAGAPLSAPNAVVRVDFGSARARRVSLYGRSSQGPCALAFAADDAPQAWARADEPSIAVVADSYGAANSTAWFATGPFGEAAARLAVPHLDIDAIGGTGYAPNSAPGLGNAGDAFPARVAGSADTEPDLVISAGGINDNNSLALFPYASAEAARAGFESATAIHFERLRAALPGAVLVAMGPWAPRQSLPTDPVALSKADAIRRALAAAGGPWIFLDNLAGGWACSSGASAAGSGPWQTGTGNSAAPRGDGNGDLYLSADGVHPNAAGCAHLGECIATALRQALATL